VAREPPLCRAFPHPEEPAIRKALTVATNHLGIPSSGHSEVQGVDYT
jgi:hypothetical protein